MPINRLGYRTAAVVDARSQPSVIVTSGCPDHEALAGHSYDGTSTRPPSHPHGHLDASDIVVPVIAFSVVASFPQAAPLRCNTNTSFLQPCRRNMP